MRPYFLLSMGFVVTGAIVVACGSSSGDGSDKTFDDPPTGDASTPPPPSTNGDSGTFGDPDAGDAGDLVVDGCSDDAKSAYVVATDHTLYRFEPNHLKFTAIGKIDCSQAASWTKSQDIHSMAVDRDGTAWVNISGASGEGGLFKVSTKDASCTHSGFETTGTWASVGMGFVANTSGDDTLYLFSDGTLASFDRKALTPTDIGGPSANGDFYSARGELTGTGKGELFGVFVLDALAIGKFDRTTGDVVKKVVDVQNSTPVANTAYSYAFSYWGGDFWVYVATGGKHSKVIRYKAATDGSQEVVLPDVGFDISGAGVSTCAPTKPVVN